MKLINILKQVLNENDSTMEVSSVFTEEGRDRLRSEVSNLLEPYKKAVESFDLNPYNKTVEEKLIGKLQFINGRKPIEVEIYAKYDPKGKATQKYLSNDLRSMGDSNYSSSSEFGDEDKIRVKGNKVYINVGLNKKKEVSFPKDYFSMIITKSIIRDVLHGNTELGKFGKKMEKEKYKDIYKDLEDAREKHRELRNK